MATVAYDTPLPPLQQHHRSHSDSNLLEANGNTQMYRMGSVGDLSPQKAAKKKGFLHKLVRPWKWKKKKRDSSKDLEPGTCKCYKYSCKNMKDVLFLPSGICRSILNTIKQLVGPACDETMPIKLSISCTCMYNDIAVLFFLIML